MASGTGRNGTERFGDWLVGESGETQGCRYFLKKDNVCGKVVSMRIGMGYDVHRLVEGRDLIIGELLEENHVFIENIDATIIAQAPKMRPHIDTMRENIAKALLIDVGQVNVKATTEEGLGFTGSGEGISSQAICLVTTPFDLTAQAMQGGCGSCSGCPKS